MLVVVVVQVHRDLSPDARPGDQHRSSSAPHHRLSVDVRHRLLLAVARPVDDDAETARRRPLHLDVHVPPAARPVPHLLHGRPHHLLRRAAADRQRAVRTHRADALLGRRRSAVVRRPRLDAVDRQQRRRGRNSGGGASTIDVPASAEQSVDVVGERQQLANTGRSVAPFAPVVIKERV